MFPFVFTFHYVSISTEISCNINQPYSDLHSTMYLFQHEKTRSGYHPFIHLHSTMYLFQLRRWQLWRFEYGIYIPLCIYFNKNTVRMVSTRTSWFTFHYVSISTRTASELPASYVNLHSTMYLFQHLKYPKDNPSHSYLHSTMYLFQPLINNLYDTCIKFYIPLCIYFNYRRSDIFSNYLWFTFHYVSISTSATGDYGASSATFTFHYVSI